MSYKEEKEKRPILVGPWGGQGGSPWDDGVYTTVRQLVIVHGAAIDSIRIEYDKKGSSIWSEKHGGNGGTKTDKVQLDHPYEVLTSVSGHYGSITNGSPIVVRSLMLESNQTKYGPFGVQQGTNFSFPMSGGKIVGFHGRAGWYLDSIGFYLKHLQSPNPSKALVPSQSLTLSNNDKLGYNVVGGSNKGYDIVLAVRDRGDNFTALSNNYARDDSPTYNYKDVDLKNKMVAFPSYIEERGTSISGGPITYGPWGGRGGVIFDDGIYTGVRQIRLSRNVGITSILVQYDKNGQSVWGNKQGGSGGIRSDKIIFDFPFEILTHITGYFGTTMLMGPTAVKSLTFHTTRRTYGPYGDEQGTFFSSPLVNGMIVGFHGRSWWYIDSIGVHVLEGKASLRQTPSDLNRESYKVMTEMDNPQWSNNLVPARRGIEEEVTYGLVKEPVPSGPGPWGGEGGKPWDDGVYSGIKQIYITREEAICSIQIEYDRSGQSVWSSRHGSAGETTHRIRIEYPNEVLNCITGYYSEANRVGMPNVIRSLTFYTTRGRYGPFGEQIGTFFTSTKTEGKVVGFHGRSGLYLDAIGVHMQHWLGDRRPAARSMLSKYLF